MLHVTLLSPIILRWLLGFWKLVHPFACWTLAILIIVYSVQFIIFLIVKNQLIAHIKHIVCVYIYRVYTKEWCGLYVYIHIIRTILLCIPCIYIYICMRYALYVQFVFFFVSIVHACTGFWQNGGCCLSKL
jgi:hypothetical protein